MRVLLIEDDSATAQSIELMLKSEGFNVYTTDLGEEGIDLGKIYDYDIILLDLNLPDMNGIEVLRQLRVGKINTPVMILSGSSEIDTKVKTFGGGADDGDELTQHCVDVLLGHLGATGDGRDQFTLVHVCLLSGSSAWIMYEPTWFGVVVTLLRRPSRSATSKPGRSPEFGEAGCE